jgi:hypothetical protein
MMMSQRIVKRDEIIGFIKTTSLHENSFRGVAHPASLRERWKIMGHFLKIA